MCKLILFLTLNQLRNDADEDERVAVDDDVEETDDDYFENDDDDGADERGLPANPGTIF